MQDSTIDDLSRRHGFSPEAIRVLWQAIISGGGGAAQFSHPEFGGMGQWQNGMIMIGDMFNSFLRDRVARLCGELAGLPVPAVPATEGTGFRAGGRNWWPDGLGTPSSTGAQNSMRYACFPNARRLAVEHDGRVTIYDTGPHLLTGFSQAQSTAQTLTFTGAHGPVRLLDLPIVG